MIFFFLKFRCTAKNYSRVHITHQVKPGFRQHFPKFFALFFAKFQRKSEKLAKFGLTHQARK